MNLSENWREIDTAAHELVNALLDQDSTAAIRQERLEHLRELVKDRNVRPHVVGAELHLFVPHDMEVTDFPAIGLALVASRIEQVRPDGRAFVLKCRQPAFHRATIPMTTEPGFQPAPRVPTPEEAIVLREFAQNNAALARLTQK